MKTRLEDVIAANSLLVSLGAEDQMPRLAAASIERALTLQDRLDRALAYAASTPPNSAHARQMARILDGSITPQDEEDERAHEQQQAGLFPAAAANNRRHLEAPKAKPKPAGKSKPSEKRGGLAGRSTAQRRAFREWIADQGIELGLQGPVPVHLVEQYDAAMEAIRQHRAAERRQKSA